MQLDRDLSPWRAKKVFVLISLPLEHNHQQNNLSHIEPATVLKWKTFRNEKDDRASILLLHCTALNKC